MKSDEGKMFFLQWSRPTGEMMYSFVSVPMEKVPDFKEKLEEKKPFNVEEYGIIVRWGNGKPDEEVIQEMKEKFDFDIKQPA